MIIINCQWQIVNGSFRRSVAECRLDALRPNDTKEQ